MTDYCILVSTPKQGQELYQRHQQDWQQEYQADKQNTDRKTERQIITVALADSYCILFSTSKQGQEIYQRHQQDWQQEYQADKQIIKQNTDKQTERQIITVALTDWLTDYCFSSLLQNKYKSSTKNSKIDNKTRVPGRQADNYTKYR